MEFLDFNLTRDSSLLLHAIHSPFYWLIFKKTILFSGFKKILTKKSAREGNSSFVKRKNYGRKQGKTSCLRRLGFMPRKLD